MSVMQKIKEIEDEVKCWSRAAYSSLECRCRDGLLHTCRQQQQSSCRDANELVLMVICADGQDAEEQGHFRASGHAQSKQGSSCADTHAFSGSTPQN